MVATTKASSSINFLRLISKKKNNEDKKRTISVSLDATIFDELESLQLKSKSELINWLLREHLKVGGQNEN